MDIRAYQYPTWEAYQKLSIPYQLIHARRIIAKHNKRHHPVTQQLLAHMIGISRVSVNAVEAGRSTGKNIKRLFELTVMREIQVILEEKINDEHRSIST